MYCLLLPFLLFGSIQFFIEPIDATNYQYYPDYSMNLDYSKIFCNGDVPKRIFGEITKHWNPNDNHWSHLNFTSLAHLCSVHGNPLGNMGGKCLMSGIMYYDIRRGNKILLSDPHLQLYCKEKCFCTNNEDKHLAEDWTETLRRKGMMIPVPLLPQATPIIQSARAPPPTPRMYRLTSQVINRQRPSNKLLPPCRGTPTMGNRMQICI
ncbi:hypothetical protein MMC30_008472 [Trapelia coarctata]|nr:hypothetical protein [Trapelia coarctata]